MLDAGALSKIRAIADDPLKFIALLWPGMKLYEKQVQILESLNTNVVTAVHAANACGKTRTAALSSLYFYLSRTPAKVVLTSATEGQLRNVLWEEINALIQQSAIPLPIRQTHLRIEKLLDSDSDQTVGGDYLIGYAPRQSEAFQGHHAPATNRPRTLSIIDEGSGVPAEIFDAAESWAHRMVVIGNPLMTIGRFYEICKAGDVKDPADSTRLATKVISISGLDSPNVQAGVEWEKRGRVGKVPILIPGLLGFDDYRRRLETWDQQRITTRLHGQFDESGESFLFPMEWLDRAEARYQQLESAERSAVAMGVDTAQGRDLSVWTIVDRMGVIDQIAKETPNTMQIAGLTIRLMSQYKIHAKNVLFDVGAGGKQICDRLKEQKHDVASVSFGASPTTKPKSNSKRVPEAPRHAYANMRAELYGTLRELLDPNASDSIFALPPGNRELREELAVLPLQYDSEGKLFLPPKSRKSGTNSSQPTLRSILGRSPDRADSLVLATFALQKGQRMKKMVLGTGNSGSQSRRSQRYVPFGFARRMLR